MLATSAPASSAVADPVQYDVLGDSYAAGYGVAPTTGCGRSAASYGVLLDGRAGLALDDLVACPRASTTSMVADGQLDALDGDTGLVLLSVGANDVRWAEPAVACLLRSNAECVETTAALARRTSDELPALLDALYDQVSERAPLARVVVTGYPRLFTPAAGTYLGGSPIEQKRVNDDIDLLNSVIRSAALGHGFGFVDVTARFAGHGANSAVPWIFGLRLPSGKIDRRAFHPGLVGYESYANAIVVLLRQSG